MSPQSGIELITGASGFIGRRLRRPNSRVLVRTSTGAQNESVGDLLVPASLEVACSGVDIVFHCAGYAHAFTSSDASAHRRINFEGTRNLLRAAADTGVRRLVFLSSVKAMADPGLNCGDESLPGVPETPYGLAKRAAEDAVLEFGAKHGVHVTNLRLVMVYGSGGRGNLERMARGIAAGWFPPLPETGNRRSLVHVQDVVDVARLVAGSPKANGKTYVIAGPRAYSGREIYDAIREAVGIPSPRWHVPSWLLRTAGMLGDALGTAVHRPFPLNSEAVNRLLDSAFYSSARIEAELGWRATISLTDGIREMLGCQN